MKCFSSPEFIWVTLKSTTKFDIHRKHIKVIEEEGDNNDIEKKI